MATVGVAPGVTPPHSPSRASGGKGGVAPVFSLSAGAVRSRRCRTNNPNRHSGTWTGGMLHPPPTSLCCTPPLCRCNMLRDPHRGPHSPTGRSRSSASAYLVEIGRPRSCPPCASLGRCSLPRSRPRDVCSVPEAVLSVMIASSNSVPDHRPISGGVVYPRPGEWRRRTRPRRRCSTPPTGARDSRSST